MPRSTRAASHASELEMTSAPAVRPALPASMNEMITVDRAPSHKVLVERRCLGQTELKVRPGQVGTSNATKPDNLGVLDYAHLRVPLPPNLDGSGVFSKTKNHKWPESYFLMRRSDDGYVSATGMFKAAYPCATLDEESAEKEYIKSLKAASHEEVAGNIWIKPEAAVELAKDYGVEIWIAALLSPEPIVHGASQSDKHIRSPPVFRTKEDLASIGRTPEKHAAAAEGRKSTRGTRSMRSVSPTKTPSRKMATPRKPRRGRGALSSVDETDSRPSTADAHENGEPESSTQETVRVQIESETIPALGGGEEEKTSVSVEMPVGADVDLPEDPQAMIEQARKMVHEARRIDGQASSAAAGKRKADDVIDDSDEGSGASKRVKASDLELRKEKIKKRALMGTAATLAIGALLPSIMAAFGGA